jgi:CDP-diacylglycerol pyrophosphatase
VIEQRAAHVHIYCAQARVAQVAQLAAASGSSFWQQLLAAASGSSFWQQLLAAASGSSFWQQEQPVVTT